MPSRRKFLAASAAGLVSMVSAGALAQPAGKPVRILVPFPPGGATDLVARLIAEELRGRYAPTVIVENRPGASGRLALDYLKNAEADGSVMLYTPDFPVTLVPHVYKRMNYDPLRDFTAVSTCSASTTVMAAGPALPANVKSVAELLQWFRANPKLALFGAPSPGSAQHFVGVMLARDADIELTHVSYKGGAAAIQDLLGGQIPVSINPLAEVLPHVRAGKLRILAAATLKRSRFLPEVPTLVESGYKDVFLRGWSAVFVPAKTPPDTVAKLHAAINAALNTETIAKGFEKFTYEVFANSLPEAAAILRADYEKWGAVVRASGFSADN